MEQDKAGRTGIAVKTAGLFGVIRAVVRILLLVFLGFALLLFVLQDRMIYHPRPYARNLPAAFAGNPVEIKYSTSAGNQTAFYIPPKNAALAHPARIWVMFAGNGSLALDWIDLTAGAPDRDDGFLLIDYPGYGSCEGSASPDSIEESAEQALAHLGSKLNLEPDALDQKLNAIGHSIGCGAALNFCVRHPVRKIILIAPFTSLRDMARNQVGFPLCLLLRHNFDNRARLAELAARTHSPAITLFHGTADALIPIRMGRELTGMFPSMIRFREVPEAGHNTVVYDALPEIHEAMEDTALPAP